MESAIYFRQKADQCRRLAVTISHSDPTAAALEALALEFDTRAAALDAKTAAALAVGYGDDIGDFSKGPTDRSD